MATEHQKKIVFWTRSALLLGVVLFVAGLCVGLAGIDALVSRRNTQDIGSFSCFSLLFIIFGLGLLRWGIRALQKPRNVETVPAQVVKSESAESTPSKIYCITCHQFIGATASLAGRKVSCFPDNQVAYLCSRCAHRFERSSRDFFFVQMESSSDCRKVLLGLQAHSVSSDSNFGVDERLSVDKLEAKLHRFWMSPPGGYSPPGSSCFWTASWERINESCTFTRILQYQDYSERWDDFFVTRLSDTEYYARARQYFGPNSEGSNFEV